MAEQELKIKIKSELSEEGLARLKSDLLEIQKQLIDLKSKFGGKSEWVKDEQKAILDLKAEIKNYQANLQALKKQELNESKQKIEEEKKAQRQAAEENKKRLIEEKELQKQIAEENKRNAKFTGQVTDLNSIAALRDRISYYTQERQGLDINSQKYREYTAKINENKQALREATGANKENRFAILEYGENLATVLRGITQFTSVIKDLGDKLFQIGLAGAEFKNLKKHFDDLSGGAENANDKIILLRQAASGNLNDAELIKYANKMGDLGYTTEQTAQFLDIAETSSDNLGITIEEANSKILTFIETGRGKGLKEVGISFAEVKAEMDKLASAQDLDLKKLDEEALKRIRSNAIITLYGHSVSDIAKKEMDEADMLEQLTTAFENAKLKIGEIVGGVLSTLANLLGTNTEKVAVFITVLGGLVTGVIAVTSAVYMLTIAMKGLDISMGGLLTVLGAVVAIAGVFAISFDGTENTVKGFKSLGDEINSTNENLKELTNTIENTNIVLSGSETKNYDEALKSLAEKYPSIANGLDTTTGEYIVNKEAVEQLNQSLNNELEAKQKINDLNLQVQANQAIVEFEKNVEGIEKTKEQLELLQSEIDAYNSSVLGYAVNSKGLWYVTSDMAESAKRKIDELNLSLLKQQPPLEVLKSQWKQMILEGLKAENINEVLQRITASTKGNVEQVNALRQVFKGLSDTAVAEFLKINNAVKNSADLQKIFSMAMGMIKSDNLLMQQQGQKLLNDIAKYNQNRNEPEKSPYTSPTSGRGRNERALENTEEKETIDKVINSIKTAIEYETKWGVLKKEFYQSELDYLKSKESLANEGKNETERQKNLTAYKDELLLLANLVQQYDIFGKKVNETTGVLKQSQPEKRRSVSISDSEKELKDWIEFNKNLPFNKEKSALEEYAERVAEAVKTMTEAFGGFFGAMVNGQKVGDAFKDLLKQLAMQLLNFLEVQYLAATASTFFKAIFSLGGTLSTDLIWQMIGFTALQAAKGLVGALAEGGEFMQGAYLVGERGPELALMGNSGYMVNNKDLTNLLSMKMNNNNYNNNNINFGVDVDWLKLRKVSDKEYNKYKNFSRT